MYLVKLTRQAIITTNGALRVGLVALLFSAVVLADSITDGSTPLGLAPGSPAGSFSLSGFDNINFFNGNLDFRMPLLRIGGRGSAGYTMMLGGQQKWRIEHWYDQFNNQHYYWSDPNWWQSLGVGYSAGVMEARSSGVGTYTCENEIDWPPRFTHTYTRLTFTAADGTEYEFRDQLTAGKPAERIISAYCMGGYNRGRTFVSADGTAATFISDNDIVDITHSDSPDTYGVSGYLMLRDGTRYRIDNGMVTWMRDRNGNRVSFNYANGYQLSSITDSMNRSVTITYQATDAQYGTGTRITYKGFGGATRSIFLSEVSLSSALQSGSVQTYQQLFPELNASSSSQYNPAVIGSIWLPNGQRYRLLYNAYGEMTRVILPTGGAIEYEYAAGLSNGAASGVAIIGYLDGGVTNYQVYRRVIRRSVYKDQYDSVPESTMTVSRPESVDNYTYSNTATVGYVDVDQRAGTTGTLLARQRVYFYGSAAESFYPRPGSFSRWQDGREYQTDTFDANGTIVLRRTTTTWQQRASVSWWSWWQTQWTGVGSEPPNDTRVAEIISTIEPSGANLVSKQTFSYDDSVPYNNQSDVYEYGFGTGSPGALVRRTHTNYVTSSSYTDAQTGAHIRSLPSQASIYDGSGIERARTTKEFDNYISDANHAPLTPRSNISGFDSAFTTSYTTRGNLTGSTRYLLVNGSVTGSISAYSQYDIAGNIVKTIDARGNPTYLYFSDCFGTPNGEARTNIAPTELGSLSSYALPTRITNALGQTAYAQYDYHLSQPVDGEDGNGIVASGSYSDTLDRPTQVIKAANLSSPPKNQTTFAYDDVYRTVTTTSDQNSFNDPNPLKGQVVHDGLGRTTESRQYEGGSNYIAVQTQYDALGRAFKTSNPFRPWQSESAVWTTSTFDALGRVTSVTTPDNAVVATSYSSNTVTVTDQAGKARKSVTDVLGQFTSVYEDPNGLNYLTNYSYDVLNNLIAVTQGSQTRSFVYDSLKRLSSATNSESGTMSYQYDNNGNLTSKTDARSITTSYAYDVLNRPISRSYNDNPQTPSVNFYYDSQSLPSEAPSYTRGYSTGRLVAVTYGGSSSGNYYGFDALGSVVTKYQRTDSVNCLVEATYNLASAVTSEIYPSVPGAGDRRTVTYAMDAVGRLASLNSNATSYAPAASVSEIGYASHNVLKTETYGNSLVHSITHNNRLQATAIKLGTAANPTSVLNLTYNYGTTNNNGNLLSVGYSGGGLSYTQNFGYDALNRLTTSNENGGASWSQTNAYDQYGNRRIDYGGGNYNLAFSSTTNRITTSGYSYDAAGNLTNDTVHTYAFDAENKITRVDNVSAYVYDGEGQRVRKLVGENTRFIYGIGGQLVAEFNGSNGSLNKEYIQGGASLITIEPTALNSNGTRYTTSDHLGSPRVVTSSAAGVVSRHDYMPFGVEIGAGTGGRTTGMGYSVVDGIRQKFTSYERDSESGLDFAQGRYYGSVIGRFVSVDPLLSTGSPWEPQSWNRYSYVKNNPMNRVDPSGLWDWGPSLGGKASDTELRQNVCAQAACTGEERKAGKRTQAEVEQIIQQRRQFRQAIEFLHMLLKGGGLTTAERARLQSISNAYGTENDGGVGIEPTTGKPTTVSIGGRSAVFLDFSKRGVFFNISAVHEGSHVSDYFDYFYRGGPDLTQYEMERRGFEAEGIAAKARGLSQWETQAATPADELLWNKSWKEADVQAARSSAAGTNVQRRYPLNGRPLAPSNSGPRFSNLPRVFMLH